MSSGVLFTKEILLNNSVTQSHATASNVAGFVQSTKCFIYTFFSMVVLHASCCTVTLTTYQGREIHIKEMVVLSVQNRLLEEKKHS